MVSRKFWMEFEQEISDISGFGTIIQKDDAKTCSKGSLIK
jgi:hypothetical protein